MMTMPMKKRESGVTMFPMYLAALMTKVGSLTSIRTRIMLMTKTTMGSGTALEIMPRAASAPG